MTVTFELDGLELTALNGGPRFHLTEAMLQMEKRDIHLLQKAHCGA